MASDNGGMANTKEDRVTGPRISGLKGSAKRTKYSKIGFMHVQQHHMTVTTV